MKELSKKLEGYETDQWSIDAVLDVELMTHNVIDPCCGFGVLGKTAQQRGHSVTFMDIHRWVNIEGLIVKDFFKHFEDLTNKTVFLNAPFSLACDFIDHARTMNARKIICFQRHAWREGSISAGKKRGQWWEKNRPARIWLCGDRAQCIRFDLRGQILKKPPTAHAWFIYERGHTGAEITRALYKDHQYSL